MGPAREPRVAQRPSPRRTETRLPPPGAGDLPQSVEAEVSVLGAMIISNEMIDAVGPMLTPSAFSSAAHAKIYEAILALHGESKAVDFQTLANELERHDALEAVGSRAYLGTLVDSVPAAANAEYYAEIVREKAITRDLLGATREIFDSAAKGELHSRELLDQAEAKIFKIAERGMRGDVEPIQEALKAVFKMIESGRDGMLTGIATGFRDLDELTSGLQNGELIIIAGRPSMGKTSLALNILEHVGVRLRQPAAIFSLEMTKEQLARNMLCSHMRIDSHRVRRGRLSDRDHEALSRHIGDLYDAPIFIDDSPTINCFELRAKVRRLKAGKDLKLVIVDYIQLIEGPDIDSRVQQISAISRSLKGLAREMNIPVIALAQLNRQVETRDDHRPRMADLRESGSLEQDADVVLLLHRRGYYTQDTNDASTELIVAKQRNGPTGKVNLAFLRQYMRFESSAEGFRED